MQINDDSKAIPRKLRNGLILLSLTMLLTSCATRTLPGETKVIKLVPDSDYTEETREPVIPEGKLTNRDLKNLCDARLEALRSCNSDKASVRAWANSTGGTVGDVGPEEPDRLIK